MEITQTVDPERLMFADGRKGLNCRMGFEERKGAALEHPGCIWAPKSLSGTEAAEWCHLDFSAGRAGVDKLSVRSKGRSEAGGGALLSEGMYQDFGHSL